jgi:hypothetical protein
VQKKEGNRNKMQKEEEEEEEEEASSTMMDPWSLFLYGIKAGVYRKILSHCSI